MSEQSVETTNNQPKKYFPIARKAIPFKVHQQI